MVVLRTFVEKLIEFQQEQRNSVLCGLYAGKLCKNQTLQQMILKVLLQSLKIKRARSELQIS